MTERATGQARENLELAEGRYQTGVGNVIELVDAQRARASADAEYVSALYDHQIADRRARAGDRPGASRSRERDARRHHVPASRSPARERSLGGGVLAAVAVGRRALVVLCGARRRSAATSPSRSIAVRSKSS